MSGGRFYSEIITTLAGDEDIMAGVRATLAIEDIVLTHAVVMTIISADNIGIDINGSGVYSYLYADPDAIYSLSLGEAEVMVSSLLVETLGHTVWLGIVY